MQGEYVVTVYRTDNQTTITPTTLTTPTKHPKADRQKAETFKNDLRTTDNQRSIYYLQAEFLVRRENQRAFQLLMTRLMSVIYELFGWELVQASYPITGGVNRFTHIWRITNPDSILHVMRHGAFDFFGSGDASKSQAEPRHDEPLRNYFKRIYREIQKVVEDTTHQLTTSLPHDPNSAGHQSQTLLIDVDGDIFIIEHEKMREAWHAKDINTDLMAARQLRNYLLWGPAQLEAKAQAATQCQQCQQSGPVQEPRSYLDRPSEEEEAAYQQLVTKLNAIQAQLPGDLKKLRSESPTPQQDIATIQNLLNEGVTHAHVEREGEAALLINLSALKARPVLQQSFDITKHVEKTHGTVNVAFGQGNGAFDAFQRLLIATPWGSVYDVKAGDIEGLAQRVDDGGATRKRVAPIVKYGATLASVLEAPDDVIGDGCVCYVINLSSFCGGEQFHRTKSKFDDANAYIDIKRFSDS